VSLKKIKKTKSSDLPSHLVFLIIIMLLWPLEFLLYLSFIFYFLSGHELYAFISLINLNLAGFYCSKTAFLSNFPSYLFFFSFAEELSNNLYVV
jgi:hypothetical protein